MLHTSISIGIWYWYH